MISRVLLRERCEVFGIRDTTVLRYVHLFGVTIRLGLPVQDVTGCSCGDPRLIRLCLSLRNDNLISALTLRTDENSWFRVRW